MYPILIMLLQGRRAKEADRIFELVSWQLRVREVQAPWWVALTAVLVMGVHMRAVILDVRFNQQWMDGRGQWAYLKEQ